MAVFASYHKSCKAAPPVLEPGSYVLWDVDAPEKGIKRGSIVKHCPPDKYEVRRELSEETEKVLTWAVRAVDVREPWQFGVPFMRCILAAQDSGDPARWAAVDSLKSWFKKFKGCEMPLAQLEDTNTLKRTNAAKTVLDWGVATNKEGFAANGGPFVLLFGHAPEVLMADFRHSVETYGDPHIRTYVMLY